MRLAGRLLIGAGTFLFLMGIGVLAYLRFWVEADPPDAREELILWARQLGSLRFLVACSFASSVLALAVGGWLLSMHRGTATDWRSPWEDEPRPAERVR